jgi:Cu2+-exporting ATPase
MKFFAMEPHKHYLSHRSGKHLQIHHAHHQMIRDFKKRFWIALILTFPVLILSPTIQSFLHYELTFPGAQYSVWIIASIIFFYGGWPFFKGFYREVIHKNPGMMTLIAVAVAVAYFYSALIVFGVHGRLFFGEVATLIDIMLLGHWLEMKSVLSASRSLEMLIQLMPSVAHIVKGKTTENVDIRDLQVNDVVLVKSGERVPADGKIVEGESFLDESMLTGESKPVRKKAGDQTIGGSVNSSGVLKVQIERMGEDSYLSKVIALVGKAQRDTSKNQRLADSAARWLTFIAILVGTVTLLTWLFLGRDFSFSLERMVTVMVIACPHALGLAIPLVVAISTTLSAQKGLLVRNKTAFENARKISTVVFDKTGTLTKGNFAVAHYESLSESYQKDDVLRFAGALEQNSQHPIAVSIMQTVKKQKLSLPVVTAFHEMTGQGVEGQVDDQTVKIVGPSYLAEQDISAPKGGFTDQAETIVFILVNDQFIGLITLSDQIRQESYEAVRVLKDHDVKVMMITGDHAEVAESVSDQLGLHDYFSEVLPHQKLEIIKELQDKGEFVAMTGDGINDAPALAQADIGIAIGSGTDIAAETADIILVRSDPRDVVSLIGLGRATYRKMIQNLIWATAYNVFAIPLATGVLFPLGIVLNPAVGAVLMSLSTIVVAMNAQLLRRELK